MRMIPIQSRSFIFRDPHSVFETRGGTDQSAQRFILMACWRKGQSVEMEIRARGGHRAACAIIFVRVRSRGSLFRQIVGELQHQVVPWMHAQCWSLNISGCEVTISPLTVAIDIGTERKIYLQRAFATPHAFGI